MAKIFAIGYDPNELPLSCRDPKWWQLLNRYEYLFAWDLFKGEVRRTYWRTFYWLSPYHRRLAKEQQHLISALSIGSYNSSPALLVGGPLEVESLEAVMQNVTFDATAIKLPRRFF